MSKLRRATFIEPKIEEVEPAGKHTATVPIRVIEANLLIGQNGLTKNSTVHNAIGVYYPSIPTEKAYSQTYFMLYSAVEDKARFLIADACMSTLNSCIASGLIDPNTVDLKDLDLNLYSLISDIR